MHHGRIRVIANKHDLSAAVHDAHGHFRLKALAYLAIFSQEFNRFFLAI
jgi:hypothetical protein